MIVLISGDGKYSLEGADLETVMDCGRQLYALLKEGNFREFSAGLRELHDIVKRRGKPVDIFRVVDVIIPPDCEPHLLVLLMGLQKTP
jgi:hypothetical protein